MIAPDGKRYTNRMQFRRIERPHLIEIDHGADKDNDPGIFRTTITFDEQSDGKTVITLRQLHPTKSQRDAGIGFGAVEFGYQTLEKLAQHVEREDLRYAISGRGPRPRIFSRHPSGLAPPALLRGAAQRLGEGAAAPSFLRLARR